MAGHVPSRPDRMARRWGDGPNPFADDESPGTGSPDARNPFASLADAPHEETAPAAFECTLPDRSRRILTLGLVGAGLAAISVLLVAVGIATGDWLESAVYGLPASFFALVFAIPACTLGQADLRAMRAGAMPSNGRQATRTGWWLGSAAIAIGLMPALMGLGSILAVFFS